MRSSYTKDDVTILLKDITGMVSPKPTEEREKLIQSGRHYSEMLPIEYKPSKRYMEAYEDALKNYAKPTAIAAGRLADKIIKEKGNNVVLVSLARAGIPIGIIIKRYIAWKYTVDVKHYSISIIRGRGIDHIAIKHILNENKAKDILFVDGWTGKGAILKELKNELKNYPDISSQLAVIADPANITDLCGTHDDIMIPSSCLNSTVSGLISRTFLRDDIIKDGDFHGAVFYKELAKDDLSHKFIDTITSKFQKDNHEDNVTLKGKGIEEVEKIREQYKISDINLIKPGIGETTRVLLRRVPWKVLISENHKEDVSLTHILRLAEEKDVPIQYYPLKNYRACGIIKNLADD